MSSHSGSSGLTYLHWLPRYRAGSNIVLHKDSAKNERWEQLKETNPVLRRLSALRRAYGESEDPLIVGMRTVTETIGGWFDENETAQVTRMMKAMDRNFSVESFSRELREYIIPEVVDAYISADRESLLAWCSEAVGAHIYFIPSFFDLIVRYHRRIMFSGQLWRYISNKD